MVDKSTFIVLNVERKPIFLCAGPRARLVPHEGKGNEPPKFMLWILKGGSEIF